MNFLDIVKKRRSCRGYSPKPVSRKIIEKCLEAARLAPSACNSQPWYFIVVDDKRLKDKICERAFSGVYSICSFAKDAPVLVVVVRDSGRYIARVSGFLRGVQYSLIDIGIACEHFVLQATEHGLGTCWIGWFNEKWVKKVLNIPKNKNVDVIISLGYPKVRVSVAKGRKSLDEIREFR